MSDADGNALTGNGGAVAVAMEEPAKPSAADTDGNEDKDSSGSGDEARKPTAPPLKPTTASPASAIAAAVNRAVVNTVNRGRDNASVSPFARCVHMAAAGFLMLITVPMIALSNLSATLSVSTGLPKHDPWKVPFVYLVIIIDIWTMFWYAILSCFPSEVLRHETNIRMRFNPVRWVITSVTVPSSIALMGVLCGLEVPLLFTVILLSLMFVLLGCLWQRTHAINPRWPQLNRAVLEPRPTHNGARMDHDDDIQLDGPDSASDTPIRVLDNRIIGRKSNPTFGLLMLFPYCVVSFIFVYQLYVIPSHNWWIQFLPAAVVMFGLSYMVIESLNVMCGIRFTVVDIIYVIFDCCAMIILSGAVLQGTMHK